MTIAPLDADEPIAVTRAKAVAKFLDQIPAFAMFDVALMFGVMWRDAGKKAKKSDSPI